MFFFPLADWARSFFVPVRYTSVDLGTSYTRNCSASGGSSLAEASEARLMIGPCMESPD